MTGIIPLAAAGAQLQIFSEVRRELAAATTVAEVKPILTMAAAIVGAAKAAADRALQAEAEILKLEAERKLGLLMKAQAETIGLNAGTAGRGRPALGGLSKNPPKTDDRPTLAEAGIDKNLGHRARTAAAMSEPEFEAAKEFKRARIRLPVLRKRRKKKSRYAYIAVLESDKRRLEIENEELKSEVARLKARIAELEQTEPKGEPSSPDSAPSSTIGG